MTYSRVLDLAWGQLNGQRGPSPERLGRRGICPWEMHPQSLVYYRQHGLLHVV